MTTSVPSPIFGPTGFVSPSQTAILTGVIADFQAAFGSNLNLSINNTASLATPQGQLASSTASIIGNVDALFQLYTNQVDPAFAAGRMQDAIGRIYFIERIPSQPTTLTVSCVGAAGVTIPLGALIVDVSNNIYLATGSATISGTGSVLVQFAAQIAGPTPVPSSVQIYQAIPGWDTVKLVSGVVGQNVESRAAFEQRRQLSVAANSVGTLPSIIGAVLGVPGVLDAYVTENFTNSIITIQGATLVPNSVYVAAYGGSTTAVAQAIWTKKPPGCAMNGNTTVTVTDSNSGYSPPLPSYQISFEVPPPLQIIFSINLVQNTQIPANAVQLIQTAILSAFAGGDGGPRARIGSTLLASRYYAPVVASGSGANNWAQIRSIGLGSANSPSAVFTGSIGGTAGGSGASILTVASLTSGAINVGDVLTDGTVGAITLGTTIVSQLSGTIGGVGTYLLSAPMIVATETITTVTPNLTALSVNINQEPVTLAGLILVTIT